MASGNSSPLSPQRRSVSFQSSDHASTQTGGPQAAEWTEENEAELTELKAKLKAAHKSWSAEQEDYHPRHDELENMKRKAKKAGKKAAKLARKGSDERMSLSIVGRSGGSSGGHARSISESNLADLAPRPRGRNSFSVTTRLRSFSISSKDQDVEK
ncbi:diphthine methyl ester synthase [Physcia stellaris]|nr:diphthine methyl ester synthase [Physcia stellaris]